MVPVTAVPDNVPEPTDLLRQLIQFDTSNPPGNERECISFIEHLLARYGIESRIIARSPERPNLIARICGQGHAAPIMLTGHADVVPAANQTWTHPPFAGDQVDGFIWGRGALDMRGGLAMEIHAFIHAQVERQKLAGDILLVVVSDEEAGGDEGAKFLVENHPTLFEGVRHAIGEFGGFTLYSGKVRFYPIMVAEKQYCHIKATLRGLGGHPSIPVRQQAMAKLARFLGRIDRHRLPVHVTPAARLMFEAMAANVGRTRRFLLNRLLDPPFTDGILRLSGEDGKPFDPLLHNTVCPTVLYGSTKTNVIPSELAVDLDCRLLPGYGPGDLIRELRALAGDDVELAVVQYDPGPANPDMGMFGTLCDGMRKADPTSVPIPLLLPGTTDARYFSRIGIQTYGFLPMPLPANFSFIQTIHAADERGPVEAINRGANTIYQLLRTGAG